MKNILYILSILVIGGAAYLSYQNSEKLKGEINTFKDKRDLKTNTEGTIKKVTTTLVETQDALEKAKVQNATLIAEMEEMQSDERNMNREKEEEQVKIDEADARLTQLAEINANID